MFGDMMNKLQEMQAEVEKSKKRLDSITVEGEAQGVKVIMNGNRKVTEIQLAEELMDDKEALEDLLLTAFNRSLEKADKVNETEMAGAAKGIIPNMPFGK
jgi:DNA-binding YbaB/EbfC family protein